MQTGAEVVIMHPFHVHSGLWQRVNLLPGNLGPLEDSRFPFRGGPPSSSKFRYHFWFAPGQLASNAKDDGFAVYRQIGGDLSPSLGGDKSHH